MKASKGNEVQQRVNRQRLQRAAHGKQMAAAKDSKRQSVEMATDSEGQTDGGSKGQQRANRQRQQSAAKGSQ